MRCPQCGTLLRDGAQVCDTCGANIPPMPLYPPAGGQADPWAGSEPFMAGLPDPWDDNPPAAGGGLTPRTLGDLFDPAAAPPPPPASPMRAPKQSALGGASANMGQPNMGQPNMGRPMPASGPAWPDTGSRGGAADADTNLPDWLFDHPQGWQAPGGGAGPAPDPWAPPPLPAAPFPPMSPSGGAQSVAWPDPAPDAGGWGASPAPWGRAPGTPRSPLAARGPATPIGRTGTPAPSWGNIADSLPPPAPPAPSWKRPPAAPSAPLGDAWPSISPLPSAARGTRRWLGPLSGLTGRLGGFSLPLRLGRGRAPRARPPVASRRVAGGVPQPAEGAAWHVVTPLNDQKPPVPFSYLAPPAARRPNRGIMALTGLTRLTFNLLLLGIIVAILAIPISIGLSHVAKQHAPVVSSHPTATPRPIASPPPGYQQLRTAALTIDYPATWKHGTFTLTTDPTGTIQGDIYQGSDHAAFAIAAIQAIPAGSLQAVLNTGLLPITTDPTDSYSPIVTPQLGPTIDGERWQAATYSFNLVSAHQTTHMDAVALVANRGTFTYIIIYQAPDSQFDALQSQFFAPMLATFHFSS